MTDLTRNYRICNFNEDQHEGAHVHYPVDSKDVRPANIRSMGDAKEIVLLYARRADTYDAGKFQELVAQWSSKSIEP